MAIPLRIGRVPEPGADGYLERMRGILQGESAGSAQRAVSLPFSLDDTTAGTENELQTAVLGDRNHVDLPLTVLESRYFRNILRRVNAGDAPKRLLGDLVDFVSGNDGEVWENSWVWFPRRHLNLGADQVFMADLHADKKDRHSGRRTDVERFIIRRNSEECMRVPVSYLLKIALADALGGMNPSDPLIWKVGQEAMGSFLNDNTSPEISSFHPVRLSQEAGSGRAVAAETARRFLLVQALLGYADRKFSLRGHGQHVLAYFSPHPPVRQKRLNDIISDSYYRELFMNPCLSGWDKGQEKYHYMNLCHQVLSRSQINAVTKLRDAGIITNNLVVLPNLSNISLANNGTHISIGSLKLSELLKDDRSGFTPRDEKYLGDLAIKIVEHFLPLFVGTYSAAPYRLAFGDFHPEKALGFLPHQLDYTHLRMLWRRWRKKAEIDFLGRTLTPFGPRWLDDILSAALCLRGDYVQDYRLIDYFVSLLSTDESPALDGSMGNGERLKNDLAHMGVFHEGMSVYLLYKLREFEVMGFSGFEGRYYSVFPSLLHDMGNAASLQTLLSALAYRYILQGEVTHAHIPDDPSLESERRQVFFGAAIGIPTFFVKKDTTNLFLRRILARTERTRPSRRYAGYIRVYNSEYCRALVRIIREDAADLVEVMGLGDVVGDLENRIVNPGMCSAAAQMTTGILQGTGTLSPMHLGAGDFNREAEGYYRDTLRRQHIQEGLDVVERECGEVDGDDDVRHALKAIMGDLGMEGFFRSVRQGFARDDLTEDDFRRLIRLILLAVHMDRRRQRHDTPVC